MSKRPPTESQLAARQPSSGATGTSGGSSSDPKKRPPKGHRQKGAGTVVVSRGEVKRDGLEIKEWQQTPKQLLLNYCKAEKRPSPRYVSASGAGEGKFLVRVILPDPKDQKEKDIVIVPAKDTSFDSQVEAEHAVALLALQRVDGTRNHELKLPDPYRAAWLKLTGRASTAAAASSATAQQSEDKFACDECNKTFAKSHGLDHHKKTAHPKLKRPIVDSGAISETEPGNSSTPPVVASPAPMITPSLETAEATEPPEKTESGLMSLKARSGFATEHERQAHYEQLRVRRERAEKQKRLEEGDDEDLVFMSEENRSAVEAIIRAASAKNTDASETTSAEFTDPASKDVVTALTSKHGFPKSYARLSVAHVGPDLPAALDWLLIHVPEESLPAGFDPRGMQLEVTLASNKTDITVKGSSQVPQTASTVPAVPPDSVSDEEFYSWHRNTFGIQDTLVEDGGGADGDDVSKDDYEWRSEWEALQAGFQDKEVSLKIGDSLAKFTIHLGVLKDLAPNDPLRLEMVFKRKGYPNTTSPASILRGFRSSPQLVLNCAAALAAKTKECAGEPCAFTLWDFARQLDAKQLHEARVMALITDCAAEDVAAIDFDEDGDEDEVMTLSSSQPQQRARRNRRNNGKNHGPSVEQRARHNEELLRHIRDRRSKTKAPQRQLPAHEYRLQITSAVTMNRVVIIKGETGCGKTTQVPQFLLEERIDAGEGGSCSIIVTQPRRLAAISVATRVAAEFGEEVGGVVGYRVQLEHKSHPVRTRVEFVTTGILLRRLQSDPGLQGLSHVVVDEVHERSLDSDFLLALLKQALVRNKTLKVVLMSATMDAKLFADYFYGAPVLEIPGFAFPVRELYLEDVLQLTKYRPVSDIEQIEREVDFRLVRSCVEKMHLDLPEEGAILVFVSGVAEISKAIKACEAVDGLLLLPLHGALASRDQRKVFESAPKGGRKVIVSTNVAETSITIDDIVCVIDTGRMKEVRFDAATKMSSLVDTWVSSANARQRKGRAGRVREGVCLKLYSRNRKLEAQQMAEVHRVPLEQCVLQVASMSLADSPLEFFASLVDPPKLDNVTAAIDALKMICALEELNEPTKPHGVQLTPLGAHLAKLPLDARLGKMLIFGSMLGVVEDVATVAAALSRRSPFLNPPPEKREEAAKAKKELASIGIASAAQSDHLVLVTAYEQWKAQTSEKERRRFATSCLLSEEVLRDIDKLRTEFLESLESVGFSARNEIGVVESTLVDLTAKRRRLVKASVCAGLYPNVVKIKRPSKRYVETLGGAMEAQASAREITFELTSNASRVFLHPSSINFDVNVFNSSWMVYSEIVQTTKPFVRDCTVVAPYGLLLFGGRLEVRHEDGIILCGRNLKFKAAPRIGVLIKEVRKLLDKCMSDKLANPDLALGKFRVLDACKRLIEGDGFF